jgi:raffinose/stachyose/melibiose transport system permease protein
MRRPAEALGLTLQYVICTLVALLVAVPLVNTVLGGFKSNGQLVNQPFGLPNPFVVDNYASVLKTPLVWQQLANSVIVTTSTVVLVLLCASGAAFVFARFDFRGRDVLFNIFTIGLLFPLSVAILPLFIQLRQLGLLDSLTGVVLPQVAFQLPLAILLLRGFFRGIPGELEDAAYIDGCGPFGFLWRVLLPLSVPALAVVSVLTMVASWNQFLLPLIVLNKDTSWTLPLGVMQFQGQYASDLALVMAFVVLSMLPALVFYLLAERYLIAGLTAGYVFIFK